MEPTATAAPAQFASFAYRAQTPQGQALAGSVEALNVEDARRQLAGLGLRVLDMEPAGKPVRPRAIRGDDFIAFNQQLAQLASAGLPLEQGLRLIAQDLRGRRQRAAVEQIAADLERGTPLSEAFARHSGPFPGLYGKLLEAGVKANNLPGVLLNLGRHAELVARLRAALWRALAYPMTVLCLLLAVLAFLIVEVLPQFDAMFHEFHAELPAVTRFMLDGGGIIGTVCLTLLLLIVLLPVALRVARRMGWAWGSPGALALRVPLVGPVLRRSLIARWCDAMHLGVSAGMDLPAALDLAGDVVGSPRLRHDGRQLSDTLARGGRLDEHAAHSILPATVPAALQLASEHHNLPDTLATLAQMYQQQAELRLATLPAVLTPLLLLLAALLIALAITAVLMPMVTFMQHVSGM